MNACKLHTVIDSIAYSGNTLSNEQWIVLSNSLTVLQSENHFKNVYLWGLILGQEADYYIAYGYEKDALFGRKFFYSRVMNDEDSTVTLVKAVEKFPVLYDYTLPGYVNKDEVNKAWHEVSQITNLSVDACKEKWRSCRNCWVRDLRYSIICASTKKKKKPYYLADYLGFLTPFTKLSTNMLDWGVLPTADDTSKRLTEICSQRFQGDPALVLEVVDDDPGPSAEEIEKKKMEICMGGGDATEMMEELNLGVAQLKEEDRLAATIESINHEAVIIPRGVLMKQPDGQVVLNGGYEGLTFEESDDLISYVHYRKPVQKWNTNLIARKDYNYALDFLDTIDLDLPKGCWSIQHERGGRLFILRNLYWPGYASYHWCDSPEWGFLYYGDGRKDLDVPFMIFS